MIIGKENAVTCDYIIRVTDLGIVRCHKPAPVIQTGYTPTEPICLCDKHAVMLAKRLLHDATPRGKKPRSVRAA